MECTKPSWLRAFEVALLAAVGCCAGCASNPPPAANAGSNDRFESTRNAGMIDRERERPAGRGGPVTSMSVGPSSRPR